MNVGASLHAEACTRDIGCSMTCPRGTKLALCDTRTHKCLCWKGRVPQFTTKSPSIVSAGVDHHPFVACGDANDC